MELEVEHGLSLGLGFGGWLLEQEAKLGPRVRGGFQNSELELSEEFELMFQARLGVRIWSWDSAWIWK